MKTCLYAVLLGFVWASIVAEVLAEAQCQVEPEDDMDCIANYSNVSRALQFLPHMLKHRPSLKPMKLLV